MKCVKTKKKSVGRKNTPDKQGTMAILKIKSYKYWNGCANSAHIY